MSSSVSARLAAPPLSMISRATLAASGFAETPESDTLSDARNGGREGVLLRVFAGLRLGSEELGEALAVVVLGLLAGVVADEPAVPVEVVVPIRAVRRAVGALLAALFAAPYELSLQRVARGRSALHDLSDERTLGALFEATHRALAVVTVEDERGFFGHSGYGLPQAHLLETL